MTIKHIFSDMDGTILNNRGKVSSETIDAIKSLQIPVTLVSARAPMEMADAINDLELQDVQIAFNGGLIYRQLGHRWDYISECSIDNQTATKILQLLEINFPEVSVSYYDNTGWYTKRLDEGIRYEQQLTGQAAIIKLKGTTDFLSSIPVKKIMIITFDRFKLSAIHQLLIKQKLPGISIQQSGTAYLEVTSINAQKSRGINYIVTREKLQLNEIAGFGDGHNDLPMLKMVGLPIVMDNALDEIKQVAKYVTKSNEENGVAYALKNHPAFR